MKKKDCWIKNILHNVTKLSSHSKYEFYEARAPMKNKIRLGSYTKFLTNFLTMFSIIRLNEIIDVSLGLIGVYRILGVEASPNITFSMTLIFAFPLTLLPLFSTILFLVPVIHARMHLTRTFSGFRVACSFQPVYEIGFVRLGKVPHFPGLFARAYIPYLCFSDATKLHCR